MASKTKRFYDFFIKTNDVPGPGHYRVNQDTVENCIFKSKGNIVFTKGKRLENESPKKEGPDPGQYQVLGGFGYQVIDPVYDPNNIVSIQDQKSRKKSEKRSRPSSCQSF